MAPWQAATAAADLPPLPVALPARRKAAIALLPKAKPAPPSEGEVVNNTNVSGLPIVVEPITISVAKERHMLDTTTSYNEKPAWENIAEETGITIEWVELAAGTAAERVPLMLAGGDMPDVFWALLSDAQVLQNEVAAGCHRGFGRYLRSPLRGYLRAAGR